MNYQRLEKNLTENITEAQLKLGFDERPISLNYMYTSLGHLLGAEISQNNAANALAGFAEYASGRLGVLSFRDIKDGVCITVPAEGVRFVHENTPKNSFLSDLIELLRHHGISFSDVERLFLSYSDCVCIEDKSNSGEFDYLLYFADGVPDDYRYCISVEDDLDGSHVSYHRFIPEDYEDFSF